MGRGSAGVREGVTNSSVTRYFVCFECNKPQWTIAYFDPKWLIINCHFNFNYNGSQGCCMPSPAWLCKRGLHPWATPFFTRGGGGTSFHFSRAGSVFDFCASALFIKHVRKLRSEMLRVPIPLPLIP